MENPILFPYVFARRSQTKSQQESSGLPEPLLRKHGPSLSPLDTGEKKLVVRCPSCAPLAVGSRKQLVTQALGLRWSPAGMCSVLAGRMGHPGQGRKGFHFPPLRKTFRLESKFLARQKGLLQVALSPNAFFQRIQGVFCTNPLPPGQSALKIWRMVYKDIAKGRWKRKECSA